MMTSKPDESKSIEETWDVRAIIGALPLKTDMTNLSLDDEHDTVAKKLQEFTQIYSKYRALKKDFNSRLTNMKNEKILLAKHVQELWTEMNKISEYLDEKSVSQSKEVKQLLQILIKDELAHDKIEVILLNSIL